VVDLLSARPFGPLAVSLPYGHMCPHYDRRAEKGQTHVLPGATLSVALLFPHPFQVQDVKLTFDGIHEVVQGVVIPSNEGGRQRLFPQFFCYPYHIKEIEDTTGGIGFMLLVGHRRFPRLARHGTQSDMFA
jgi:hypothetical protein